MPLYEYECDTNGHRFEVIQKYADPPPAACPKCGGTVRKLFSSPAIQFKGSGFYITDYARAGKSDGDNGQPAKSGGTTTESTDGGQSKGGSTTTTESTQAKTESKSDTKSESKAESKSETKNSPPA